MKKLLLILLLSATLISCTAKSDRIYYYTEHIKQPGANGKFTIKQWLDTFSFDHDTSAYSWAYEIFSMKRKVYRDMLGSFDSSVVAIPYSFELVDENGRNISNNIDKEIRIWIEKRADSETSTLKNNIKGIKDTLDRGLKLNL